MGILFSRIFQSLFGSKEVRILILGLDNAGKTTILYRLQNDSEENIQTIPTIGFNVEVLQYKNIKFQVWDLGGQTSIRPYWRCYYPNTDAIIFVVDSCDSERLGVAKQELLAMLEVSDAVGTRVGVVARGSWFRGYVSWVYVRRVVVVRLVAVFLRIVCPWCPPILPVLVVLSLLAPRLPPRRRSVCCGTTSGC